MDICNGIVYVIAVTEFVVNGTALRNGSVKACKRCGHLKDITNQRFGYLTAKERVYQTENGMSIWKCQCDCGNVTNVPINHLTTHHTESCGHCIKNDFYKSWYIL